MFYLATLLWPQSNLGYGILFLEDFFKATKYNKILLIVIKKTARWGSF